MHKFRLLLERWFIISKEQSALFYGGQKCSENFRYWETCEIVEENQRRLCAQ